MKKEFTYDELLNSRGCYSSEEIYNIFSVDKTYSTTVLSKLTIPLKDKVWFIYKKCELTQAEKLDLCVLLGKAVAPLYSNKYPDDTRISDCWKAIEDYREGKISIDELKEKRNNAYDAADYAANFAAYYYSAAVYAADAYAYAQDAAAYAADDAAAYAAYAADKAGYAVDKAAYAYADYAAEDAAEAAAKAADKAYSIHYSVLLNNITEVLNNILIEFCNNCQ